MGGAVARVDLFTGVLGLLVDDSLAEEILGLVGLTGSFRAEPALLSMVDGCACKRDAMI